MAECLPRCLVISMDNNTKLLVIFSFLVIILGFSLLWFGFQPKAIPVSISTPIPTTIKPESTSSGVFGIEGEKALVTRVVDGDTFEISSGQTVRIIGVDTPETVDPRRPVGCFGKEASNKTKSLIAGQEVVLQQDISEKDKYKRLLRYVFLPLKDGKLLFVNDYLIREGFALVLTYPPDVKYNSQFLEAQKEAKEAKRGLWGRC